MELQQSPQTIAFKKDVETLISTGVVAKYQEIVDALEWNKTSMSSVMKGRVNIPSEVYKKFRRKYFHDLGLSAEVASNNKKTALSEAEWKDKYITQLEKENARLTEYVSLTTGELRHIAIMNMAMLKTVRKAVAQLLAVQEKQADKKALLQVAERLNKETAAFYNSAREIGSLIDVDT